MDPITQYILNEKKPVKTGYEPLRDDIMECTICGRKVDVLNEGRGPLICCGKTMIKIGEAVDRYEGGETSMAKNL